MHNASHKQRMVRLWFQVILVYNVVQIQLKDYDCLIAICLQPVSCVFRITDPVINIQICL